MDIGINGLRLGGQAFGVARYLQYMLRYWDRMLDGPDRMTVFTRTPGAGMGLGLSARTTFAQLSPALTGLLWENFVLPRAAAALDVLFCPSYTAPLRGSTPLVVATHSVDEARPGTHSWWHGQTYSRLYTWSARRAAAVVVPARSTRESMQELYGVDGARIHAISLGVDTDAFRPVIDASILRDTRRRYLGGDVPYVLFVGKMSRRRNIPSLIRAFARLKRRRTLPHKLLLFGPNHEGLPLASITEELGVGDSVVQDDGRIAAHADIVPVYAAADVFVHPTSFDDTSLPVLEAFAVGTPVITVRTGGMPELGEGCAEFVDEPSETQLADAIERVIDDPGLRGRMRAAGLQRAAERSWENTARRTLDIVMRVGGAS